MQFVKKSVGGIVALALCAVMQSHAQGNFGGGGGNFNIGGGGAQNRAASSSTTYNPAGSVGNAQITVDPDTRNLIIDADPETTKAILEIVKNLDHPQPQVLIKVVFLEVGHNDSLDIGIEGQYTGQSSAFGRIASYLTNYNVITNFTSTGAGSNFVSGTSIVPTSVTPQNNSYVIGQNYLLAQQGNNPNGAGTYSILGADFSATLRAIAQAGKAQLLSRPSVLARNNQPATIQIGQNVPLITNVRYDTFGNAINSVSYTAVGIILKVTPFITSDGLVQMIVQPSTSALDPSLSIPISAGVSAPVIDVRSADTVIITPDGQPVVIGGLMRNDKGEIITKIPVLGDIPLIGNLFKHKQTQSSKTELMIFLTPHVIQSPTQLASIADKERAHMLTPKSYSEQELDRFLEKVPVKGEDSSTKTKKK
jgi:general secretion pathway protein D